MRWLVAGSLLAVAMLVGGSSAQAQDDAAAKRGKMLWTNRGCAGCHGFGKKMAGPDLMGVQQRRGRDWLVRWLKETAEMQNSDSTAIAMVAEWRGIKMPSQKFTDQEIEAILAYMTAEEARISAKK